MGIAALTAMMNDTVVLAGTHLPEDPNLATPGYCDESLVKTQVERARCDTKDAVAGGFFWITPFEKQQIDDAVAECEKGGPCQDAEDRVAQLSKSISEIKAALDSHNRRAGKTDAPWLMELAKSTGSDPTGYASLVRTFYKRRNARQEAARLASLPAERSIKTLVSMSPSLGGCIDHVSAGIAGTSLVVHWDNPCQARMGTSFNVFGYLYDAEDQLVRAFSSIMLKYTFRIASFSDGPTASGTVVFRCEPDCYDVTERPQEHTTVALDLKGRLSQSQIDRIASARLEFK
ncbi:hypothetical protein K2Z84_11215 [Candidatus Binatia bacterium]|nr:hypothetical protein [Candidatus Binatia bacterium]